MTLPLDARFCDDVQRCAVCSAWTHFMFRVGSGEVCATCWYWLRATGKFQ